MSTWKDILAAAADGNQSVVEEYLRVRLPSELRQPVVSEQRGFSVYEGPIVKAVVNALHSLDSQAEQEFAETRVDDVVDYITDQIIDKVKRTADIVTFCRLNPDLNIEHVAENFTGWNNLKRSKPDRVDWIMRNLGSMIQIGIQLPAESLAVREAAAVETDPVLGFEERALLKRWDVKRSWNAFRKQQEINDDFVCVRATDASDDVSAESVDFGVISESKLLSYDPLPEGQQLLEMSDLADRVVEILDSILDDFSRKKPLAAYNPIAWHNAWWHFTDKYSGMPLRLRLEQPCCDTDQLLSDHILQHYVEFLGINRLSVQRRRTQLIDKCDSAVITAVMSYLDK